MKPRFIYQSLIDKLQQLIAWHDICVKK